MRDEQIRRYARHIVLPDVGGVGQAALLAAVVELDLTGAEPERAAALVAGAFLAAGGAGALVVRGATASERAALAARGPDARIVEAGAGPAPAPARPIEIPARPPWWPAADGDATALALWRGSLAATRWMAAVIAEAR
jgi:hypothetical protein